MKNKSKKMSRLEQLQSLLADEPNEPFLLFAIAKEFEGMNDLTQARAHYERLRTTTPQYVGVYYHLGKLYERLDDPDLAVQTYTEGINVAQSQGDHHAKSELAGAKLNLVDEDNDF